ncbi:hypothetical protein FACS189419_06280 [Planctomycetales bacterium]|nr:hypothetical protein FACS189419_06280 [Planctomycetales bacterium]
MGTKELRNRDNWQTNSGAKAGKAENNFLVAFTREFLLPENITAGFTVEAKPKEFRNIYENVELSKEVLESIYDPKKDNPDKTWQHGIIPDYALRNTNTGRSLYVEVKRQDGWVEGKEPKAGRGNAHERSCKFFTPGLRKILQQYGKLGDDILPFWVVFQGDITRDPKRVREITLWYEKYPEHFFMWYDNADETPLIKHFNKHFKAVLLGKK